MLVSIITPSGSAMPETIYLPVTFKNLPISNHIRTTSPFRISKQILPSLSVHLYLDSTRNPPWQLDHSPMFGWYIFVRNRTFGGLMGYSSGRNNSRWNTPSFYRVAFSIQTMHHLSSRSTHVGTDSHRALESLHQSNAGCPHAAQQ